jgi:hypothetical protein
MAASLQSFRSSIPKSPETGLPPCGDFGRQRFARIDIVVDNDHPTWRQSEPTVSLADHDCDGLMRINVASQLSKQ